MTQGSKTMPELSLTVCLNDADQKAVTDYAQAWLDLVDALEARLDRAIEQNAPAFIVNPDGTFKPVLTPADVRAMKKPVPQGLYDEYARGCAENYNAACEDIAKRMEE